MMSATYTYWHILSLCLFPVINMVGIAASILLSNTNTRLPLTIGILFSSGILLSASLTHMLPHAVENLSSFGNASLSSHATMHDDDHNLMHHGEDMANEHDHGFPWAYTFFAIAFLGLLSIEACMERYMNLFFHGQAPLNFHSHGDHPSPRNAQEEVTEQSDHHAMGLAMEETCAEQLAHRTSSAWSVFAPRPSAVSHQSKGHSNHTDEPKNQSVNPWVSILLTLVLSLHVVLEGLHIGSSSNVETIKSTFIAVVSHKGFAAFSLGSSLVASGYWGEVNANGGNSKFYFFLLAGIYVSIDILALGVGMALNAAFDASGTFSGVLQALLGGSFLFISTVELIPGEIQKMHEQKLPLLPLMGSLLCGFVAMTVLAQWV